MLMNLGTSQVGPLGLEAVECRADLMYSWSEEGGRDGISRIGVKQMIYCRPPAFQRFFTFHNMFLKSDWLFTVLPHLLPWLLSNFTHEYRSIAVPIWVQSYPNNLPPSVTHFWHYRSYCCWRYGMVVVPSGYCLVKSEPPDPKRIE